MSPIRPDLPTPRHAATHPVSTTAARTAQAAFFQQALSAVRTAQEVAGQSEPAREIGAPDAVQGEGPGADERPRRPGSLIDIRV